jgi:bifunctional aspartokinase / homoserine dehydrogenase 1
MSYHVLKFGGSNLKKKDDILRIVNVIGKYDSSLVIVVSAFYGVTDMLVNALEKVKNDEFAITELTDALLALKMETLEEVIDDPNVREEIYEAVKSRVKRLKRYLQGVNFFGETPDFVNDTILSYGERLSALMLTGILNYYKIHAEEVLPENLGLITDGEFANATVDFDLTADNVKKAIKNKKIVVVPGFYS